MDSQLVSGTHKKLAEFCQKCNITDMVFNTCENINQALSCLKNLLKCAGMAKIEKYNKPIQRIKSVIQKIFKFVLDILQKHI